MSRRRTVTSEPDSARKQMVGRGGVRNEGLLVGVMTLNDSENYKESPLKRARWRRVSDDAVRFPSLYDPDSFYRELYDDGRLDEYWQRSNRRS